MITADEARKVLEEKAFDDQYRSKQIKLIKGLKDKEARQLGLLIFRRHKKRTPNYDEMYLYSGYDTERRNAIGDLIEAQSSISFWEKDFLTLLEIIVGKENTKAFKHAWEMMDQFPYQSGYHRRSFRAPGHQEYFLNKRIHLLGDLPDIFSHDFELVNYARFAPFVYSSYDFSRALILAAGVSSGDESVKASLLNILNGKDEIGQVSSLLIRSLLLSDDKTCWDGVENLLLSAQREEGLRQTILEALDEVSLGAMKQLMCTVANHKLTRFSSVVRALDVWTGLNWESVRGEANKRTLELGLSLLDHPENIASGVKDNDNLTVYMALWAAGVRDVYEALGHVESLLQSDSKAKRIVALYFLAQTDLGEKQRTLAWSRIDADNNDELYWVLQNLKGIKDTEIPDAFTDLEGLINKVPEKPVDITLKSFPFPSCSFSQEKVYRLLHDLCSQNRSYWHRIGSWYNDIKDADIRSHFVRLVFQDYVTHYGRKKAKGDKPALNDFQREFALNVINDSSVTLREIALKALEHTELKVDEADFFEGVLKGGNGSLRQVAINLLQKQNKQDLKATLQNLLFSSGKQQRLSGLSILGNLNDQKTWKDEVHQLIERYKSVVTPTVQEQSVIDEMLGNITPIREFTRENGFGLFDSKSLAPIPKLHKTTSGYFVDNILGQSKSSKGLFTKLSGAISSIGKDTKASNSPYSMPANEVRKQLDLLDGLIEKNKNTEIESENYDHSVTTTLLSANTSLPYLKSHISRYSGEHTKQDIWQNTALHEIWEQWYVESGLTPVDIKLIQISFKSESGSWEFGAEQKFESIKHYPAVISKVIQGVSIEPFETPLSDLKYYRLLLDIIYSLSNYTQNDEWFTICMDACEWIYASIPESYMNQSIDIYKGHRGEWVKGRWNYIPFLKVWTLPTNCREIDAERFWNLHYWRYRTQYGPTGLRAEPYASERYQFEESVEFERWCEAYLHERIGEDELYNALLSASHANTTLLNSLTDGQSNQRHFGNVLLKDYPFLKELVDTLRNRLLDIEVVRGESPTDATYYCNYLGKVFGLKRFGQLLEQIGKKPLKNVYSYGDNSEKLPTLIRLLSICYPEKSETQESFNEVADSLKLSDKRWVEIAMFASQWRPLIMGYLGWEGMDSSINWLDAHSHTYQNDNCDARISKYTSITSQAFADGAVDVDWFNDVYHQLGKQRWNMLYSYAKFVGDGSNGHARAKLYSDVILGNTKIREVTKRIDDKRNKNYVMAYGLVPLSKTNPESDMLKRYQRLQEFIKESKQFGAQRQKGEARAVEVAIENLARTAGYTEPLHFSWNMEAEQTQKILEQAQKVEIEDLSIDLVIDEQGKASLRSQRGEKSLKNVPAKHNKNKQVIKLKEYVKVLNEQTRRARRSLETSMLRGDTFSVSQLKQLMQHPVIQPMIKELVLVCDNNLGFWGDNALVSPDGTKYSPNEEAEVRIAHCTDLYADQHWSEYQHDCFVQKRTQPFKQIFRELYRPTQLELEEVTQSNRYAGHQVQPKKATALLKSRGWTVGYEDGLHKVDHQHGIIGQIYAIADWLTPAETEYPTLEYIQFIDRKTYKPLALNKVPEKLFSEFMRDVDLVVSVAHAGGIDPETSLSSIEMRQVLAEETAHLFKFDNIEIENKHIKIRGELAEYSLHLGSGVIHRMPGGNIAVIPVHAQHRGRLFLPFLDDDPKSAEILSKMVMLANDYKIKDPTILEQIQDVRKR